MDERTMIAFAAPALFLTLPLCFLGGLVLGYVYFHALRKTVDLIVGQDLPLLALVLTLGRLVLLCTGFYLAVLAGGVALLAAMAGVLCAKALMLRETRALN